jgi:cupin fold WbuC family metalloprotein
MNIGTLNDHKLTKTGFISQSILDQISSEAKQSRRLRKNYNLHSCDEDICHRLLNAMEPDSYIQPHRHLHVNKDETMVVIRGKLGMIIFDQDGNITERVLLEPTGNVMMINIPHGMFHTCVSLEERSVFFEAKAGPFIPLTQDEKAHWAPKEGDESSMEYLASLKKHLESLGQ